MITIKKSLFNFIKKSNAENESDNAKFERLRNALIAHLSRQAEAEESEKKEVAKALHDMDSKYVYLSKSLDTGYIQKSRGYPVGSIREWNGKKYKKIAPGQWKPIYETSNRGAKVSVAATIKKIKDIEVGDYKSLAAIVNANISRFRSQQGGAIIPEAQEILNLSKKMSSDWKAGKTDYKTAERERTGIAPKKERTQKEPKENLVPDEKKEDKTENKPLQEVKDLADKADKAKKEGKNFVSDQYKIAAQSKAKDIDVSKLSDDELKDMTNKNKRSWNIGLDKKAKEELKKREENEAAKAREEAKDTDLEKFINENVKGNDEKFRYMLLSRMQSDMNYYTSGRGSERQLWAGDFDKQVKYMKALYDSFPEDKKPEWITLDEINGYKKQGEKKAEAPEPEQPKEESTGNKEGYEKYFSDSKAKEKISAKDMLYLDKKLKEMKKNSPRFDVSDTYGDVWDVLKDYVKLTPKEMDDVFEGLKEPSEQKKSSFDKFSDKELMEIAKQKNEFGKKAYEELIKRTSEKNEAFENKINNFKNENDLYLTIKDEIAENGLNHTTAKLRSLFNEGMLSDKTYNYIQGRCDEMGYDTASGIAAIVSMADDTVREDLEETEAEKKQNRSEAMRGNKNAYKGGPKEEPKKNKSPVADDGLPQLVHDNMDWEISRLAYFAAEKSKDKEQIYKDMPKLISKHIQHIMKYPITEKDNQIKATLKEYIDQGTKPIDMAKKFVNDYISNYGKIVLDLDTLDKLSDYYEGDAAEKPEMKEPGKPKNEFESMSDEELRDIMVDWYKNPYGTRAREARAEAANKERHRREEEKKEAAFNEKKAKTPKLEFKEKLDEYNNKYWVAEDSSSGLVYDIQKFKSEYFCHVTDKNGGKYNSRGGLSYDKITNLKDAKEWLNDQNVANTPDEYYGPKEQNIINQDKPRTLNDIKSKYDSAKKIEGNKKSFYVGDEKIKGRYVLMEADTPTASHDETTFGSTPGFPTNSKGSNINDRDYEHDRSAQEAVVRIAGNYNGKALQDIPVITNDGIVVSGNNRTMSSKLAAKNGTDKAYIEDLKEQAEEFGFDEDDLKGFKHPRILLQIDHEGDYTTQEFAKYNKDDKKTMDNTEKAVKIAKTINQDQVQSVSNVLTDYETMGELYNSSTGPQKLADALVTSGILQQNELAQYYSNGKFSDAGQEFVETVLVGSVLNENNVRLLQNSRAIKQKLVRAILPLVESSGYDKEYNISDEFNKAVQYAATIAQDRKTYPTVDMYFDQGNLFDDTKESDIVKEFTRLVLDEKEIAFAKKMKALNGNLKENAAGQMDMFMGNVETKDEILNNLLGIKTAVKKAFTEFFSKFIA